MKKVCTLIFLTISVLVSSNSSAQMLYPLNEGLTWTYQVSMGTLSNSAPGQLATMTNMPARLLEGKEVIPQKIDVAQQSYFMFVVSDNIGVYEYARQLPGAVEPEVHPSPKFFLKLPLEEGATWEGTIQTSLLMSQLTVPTRTTVESMNAVVTVPLGTFEKCAKTRTFGETNHKIAFVGTARVTVETYNWYCPSVGLARSVHAESGNHSMLGEGKLSMELTSFER